jgi:uncharacterized coiled-coil protein SlyX
MTKSSRFETIEFKLAYLEHALQELGETVLRQQRDIEAILARHSALKEQFEINSSGELGSTVLEKPPHY